MKQWYAVHTKSRAEGNVVAALKRHEIETFFPEIQDNQGQQNRKKAAFFPGYLFMRVDLLEQRATHWRWVPGVRHVVCYGERPIAVPDDVIAVMRREFERRNSANLRASSRFQEGDKVRITGGPLAEMLAIFSGPTTADQRVTVLLEFLGRLSRVRVDPDHLELASAAVPSGREKRRRRTRGRGRRIRYQDQ